MPDAAAGAMEKVYGAVMGGDDKSSDLSRDAFNLQKQAQREQWRSEIRTHTFNIGQAKKDMSKALLDTYKSGALHLREKKAWLGAAGAEVGSGTPLMNMIQAKTDIELEAIAIKQTYEPEIEFMESEIENLQDQLKASGEQEVGGEGKGKAGFKEPRGEGEGENKGDKKIVDGIEYIWDGIRWRRF